MALKPASSAVTPGPYQVASPFVVFRGRVPDVYAADRLVQGDDPILKTHREYFASVAERVAEQIQVMVAAPPVISPTPLPVRAPSVQEKTDG